jgi:hypothetical protein
VKNYLLLFLSLFVFTGYSQEFESDLFATLHNSSLHIFKASEMSKMTVVTYRNSKKHGNVIETTSTYRKGKINTARINFNIKYSEYYAIEDRKKSLGKYEFRDNAIFKYERSDFNHNNARMYTLYFNYLYQEEIVRRENIRTKEYVSSGSVDFDTVVYKDTVIYEVLEDDAGYKRNNLSDPGVYTLFEITNGKLMSKTVHFEGFSEKESYLYDSKGHLVKITNVLTGDDNNSIVTRTELHYTIEGLLHETTFYDENDVLLERKAFAYK